VTVEGRREGEVRIDRFEIDVLRRSDALAGTYAQCLVGGAAASPRQLYVNLDRSPPRVEFVERGDSPGEAVRRHFLFSLARNEIETFLIYAVARRGFYEWTGQLSYVAEGKRHHVDITDGGDAFRTTSTDRALTYLWADGRWQGAQGT
jgi:hypothetical protein